MKICVLLPAHNEARSIGGLVAGLVEKGLPVFVVDDGSTDDSGKIAQEAGAEVLRNQQKSGKGFSLRRGFDHLKEKDFDGVIVMDSDGQHAVSDIDLFIQKARSDPDVVINGNRMHQTKDMPFVRAMTNRFMSFIISLACRQHIPDSQCGYRYLGIDVLRKIDLVCDSFEIETEILMKASKKDVKILAVPIKTIYSNEKSKINPFIDAYRFFVYFFKELFSK